MILHSGGSWISLWETPKVRFCVLVLLSLGQIASQSLAQQVPEKSSARFFGRKLELYTWRILPVSKWLITMVF